jgi:Fe2+ transport system protein FeoA
VIYSALKAFKAVRGHLLVPQRFVVPQGDVRYPPDTWGMKLGRNVDNIRFSGTYSEHRAKLLELGFSFEVEKVQQWDFLTQIYPALEAYKISIHGDLLVPQSFVVPQGDVRFPTKTWGMKLGAVVQSIRCDKVYVKYKERLTALGFVYEPVVDVQFAKIYSALEAYKAIHGDLLVPRRFVVPQGDANYPSETWGMKLGSNVNNIRNEGVYSKHRAKLEELGVVYIKTKRIFDIDLL